MTGNERKIKKRIQLIVAASMVVFFSLCLTLVVQLSIMANQRSMEASLAATHKQLQAQLGAGAEMIDYFDSQKFIDEYILRHIGYGRDGAQIFS